MPLSYGQADTGHQSVAFPGGLGNDLAIFGGMFCHFLWQELSTIPSTYIHVRVDEKTKRRATKTLAGMGISVSDAVRMLLVRVVAEKALPFDVKVPNATTVKAMRAADQGKGRRLKSAGALFKDLGI